MDGQYVHDFNYIIKPPSDCPSNSLVDACTLNHDGISLKVKTSAPSIHVYTGRYNSIYKDERHGPFSGVAFEPVRYLDAINHPSWRDCVILKPGGRYEQDTEL